MMSSITPKPSMNKNKLHRLVLVGGGHAHVQVLKALNHYSRPSDVHVTLIDPQPCASYSGMIPGCVAKLYKPHETQIQLQPLTQWADIDFIVDSVVDIDATKQQLLLAKHKHWGIPYDVVSFDIGSTSRGLNETRGAKVYTIPTRPISDLVRRIDLAEVELKDKLHGGKMQQNNHGAHVVVVGGGAAGIELSFAMRARWGPLFGDDDDDDDDGNGNSNGNSNGKTSQRPTLRITLIDAGSELLPNESSWCKSALRNALSQRNIEVIHERTVDEVTCSDIVLDDGTSVPYTHCLWAAGAAAQPLAYTLQKRGVLVSDTGWIQVLPTLQSVSHPNIFAGGDCATITNLPHNQRSPPKAGVYAVRSGPVLIENLTNFLSHKNNNNNNNNNKLISYKPQDDFLKLINCGDGTAIGFRFGIPLEGKWVWDLKDRIDRMFMNLFAKENLPDLKEGEPYDTSQYDAVSTEDRPDPLDPHDAARLLLRTDGNVDYEQPWLVIRDMMADDKYRDDVLEVVSEILNGRQ